MKKNQIISFIVVATLTISMVGCAYVKELETQPAETVAEEAVDEGPAEEAAVAAEDPTGVFEAAGIETDLPGLRDVVASADGLGDDAIVGACLGTKAANDEKYMALIGKHFNAVTLETSSSRMRCLDTTTTSPRQIPFTKRNLTARHLRCRRSTLPERT